MEQVWGGPYSWVDRFDSRYLPCPPAVLEETALGLRCRFCTESSLRRLQGSLFRVTGRCDAPPECNINRLKPFRHTALSTGAGGGARSPVADVFASESQRKMEGAPRVLEACQGLRVPLSITNGRWLSLTASSTSSDIESIQFCLHMHDMLSCPLVMDRGWASRRFVEQGCTITNP